MSSRPRPLPRGCRSRTGCLARLAAAGRPMRRRPPSSPSALLSGALASLLRDAHSSALSVSAGARRGVKRRVVSGVRVAHEGINLSSRGPMRILSRGYPGIALGYDLGYNDTIPS